MKNYILIQASEDGEPVSLLSEKDMEEMLKNPEDYGVDRFLDTWPIDSVGGTSPAYWPSGDALLMECRVIVPVIKTTEYSL